MNVTDNMKFIYHGEVEGGPRVLFKVGGEEIEFFAARASFKTGATEITSEEVYLSRLDAGTMVLVKTHLPGFMNVSVDDWTMVVLAGEEAPTVLFRNRSLIRIGELLASIIGISAEIEKKLLSRQKV